MLKRHSFLIARCAYGQSNADGYGNYCILAELNSVLL